MERDELLAYLVDNFSARDLADRLLLSAPPDVYAALTAEAHEWNNRDKLEDEQVEQ